MKQTKQKRKKRSYGYALLLLFVIELCIMTEAITPLFVRRIRGLFRAYSVRKGMVRRTQHMQYTVRRRHFFEFFSQNNGFQTVI